jgi:hypothetical protein
MNEYPHIFQDLKELAIRREERDLSMIEESIKRSNKETEEYSEGIAVQKTMSRIRKVFQNSICTEVENHQIVPLPQMYEEMKEKLPLEELLDNFEVSNSEDEDKDNNDDQSESSEVDFDDVASVGLEKMYNQFQGRQLLTRFEPEPKEQD